MTAKEASRILESYIYEHEAELGHDDTYTALSMASRALTDWAEIEEKEKPTKVRRVVPNQPNIVTPACPHCGTYLGNEKHNRCPICGQVLDWRAERE